MYYSLVLFTRTLPSRVLLSSRTIRRGSPRVLLSSRTRLFSYLYYFLVALLVYDLALLVYSLLVLFPTIPRVLFYLALLVYDEALLVYLFSFRILLRVLLRVLSSTRLFSCTPSRTILLPPRVTPSFVRVSLVSFPTILLVRVLFPALLVRVLLLLVLFYSLFLVRVLLLLVLFLSS